MKWLAIVLAALLALPMLAALWLAVFGWNWARGPLQDLALQRTGRVLKIAGDLDLDLAWPAPRVQASAVSFANPPWATDPQMLTADTVDLSVDLRELLSGRLVFPEVRLQRPRAFLEQGSGGRKTWLLDPTQTDEDARLHIGMVRLDQGELHYADAARHTAVRVELQTTGSAATGPAAAASSPGVTFKAEGRFNGQALVASGSGGPVLAWGDETRPYPLSVQATLGRTQVQATGTVTSLLRFTAVDLRLSLRGDSLASLFPLIGLALPPTPPYYSDGRLVRQGAEWRYESFSGKIGHSDIAGTLQVDTAAARPLLSGALVSRRLDLADLGPAVGAREAVAAPAAGNAARAARATRVLPDLPFDTARWDSLDADVTLQAQSLRHAESLPLEKLQLRLVLTDRQLTLDPLAFGLAGGELKLRVVLNGRVDPLHGQAKGRLKGLKLSRLLPTVDLSRTSIGELHGEVDLSGHGPSVGRMLATSEGRLSLVSEKGEISRLLMERVGLHLLEILRLNLTGDETVTLNCAVADFRVSRGVMKVQALVLDTTVNTLVGSGEIDLAQETFDLTIVPSTKVTSLVALRSPIHVTGPLGQPVIEVDTGRVALRGVGALVLGLVNPLLALIPLIEAGPGLDSECGKLVRQAQSAQPAEPKKSAPSAKPVQPKSGS
ncbi:MAG TPA: AsmA family protein [Rubrivivax sp.]|nr:AsmA family protein [Rubrivivax sp.]